MRSLKDANFQETVFLLAIVALLTFLAACGTKPALKVDPMVESPIQAFPPVSSTLEKPVPSPAPTEAAKPVALPSLDGIRSLAGTSACARYSWKNRGPAPTGYVKGMALAYARMICQKGPIRAPGSSGSDALVWYGLSTSNIPRATYTLLTGLGMRESSGKYCEGWDMSAGKPMPDGAETGLFQFSFNSMTNPTQDAATLAELKALAVYFQEHQGACRLGTFREGVSCAGQKNQAIIGSGSAAAFQQLARSCPGFAVEYGAILIRTLRKHFGPLVRKEAEYRAECSTMFDDVAAALKASPELCSSLL